MRKNIKIIMAIMVAATLFTVNNATVKANIMQRVMMQQLKK